MYCKFIQILLCIRSFRESVFLVTIQYGWEALLLSAQGREIEGTETANRLGSFPDDRKNLAWQSGLTRHTHARARTHTHTHTHTHTSVQTVASYVPLKSWVIVDDENYEHYYIVTFHWTCIITALAIANTIAGRILCLSVLSLDRLMVLFVSPLLLAMCSAHAELIHYCVCIIIIFILSMIPLAIITHLLVLNLLESKA